MSGLRPKACLAANNGFVLAEVVVAMVLLAVLIGPLFSAAQSAFGTADGVRERAADLSTQTTTSGVGEAWDWGAGTASAAWLPGPVLQVKTERKQGSQPVVGLWVEGWFLGERAPDEDGSLSVKAPEWRDASGREIVVRTRYPGSPWGPPWRSIVPSPAGDEPVVTPVDPVPADDDWPPVGGETIVHAPGLANPRVAVRPSGTLVEVDPLGLLLPIPSVGSGRCDVAVGTSVQSWYTEAGRALDVYF